MATQTRTACALRTVAASRPSPVQLPRRLAHLVSAFELGLRGKRLLLSRTAQVLPRMPNESLQALEQAAVVAETVNGRAAMLGFLAAAAVELSSGQSFFAQLEASGLQPSALWAFLLLATASLVPILRGATREVCGPFNPSNELAHCRLAMLGFAAVLAIELLKGSALF